MSEIDLKLLRAPIPIEQVEFRVQSISQNGWAMLLAYKDARVDMDRLDAVLGIEGWERKHELIDGQLFCHVGIYSEKHGRFIWKSDVGTESNTEKEKGRASDSFKRACFNCGIGRELYDYPLLLVHLEDHEYYGKEKNGKTTYFATFDLKLKDWTWRSDRSDPDENGKTYIEKLQALDEKGNLRFKYPRGDAPAAARQPSDAPAQDDSHAPAKSADEVEKPWYDDFDKDKANMQSVIDKGAKPADLVKHLRKNFKVNKKIAAAINALKPNPDAQSNPEERGTGDNQKFFDDDIPF